MFLNANCGSLTGHILYSDEYLRAEADIYESYPRGNKQICPVEVTKNHYPFLNGLARVPLIGVLAGITRCALAALHTIGHLFASILTFNSGHLAHAAKGTTEFIRGGLEALPIIGRIFANMYTTPSTYDYISMRCEQGWYEEHAKFFLIKIMNPNKPDEIDRLFGKV